MWGRLIWFAAAWGTLCLVMGCDQGTAPPGGVSQVGPSPPPPPPPPPPGVAGGAVDPAVPGTPVESGGAVGGVKSAAFLAANREVIGILQQMQALLTAAVDEATARDAAQKLPPLTRKWEGAQKGATALFLTLSKDEQSAVMAQAQQEMLAEGKPMKEDLLEAMQRLAASPERPIVEAALVDLRDTILAQHSIYATVVMRRRLAEKLGEAGSPLP
jgi:hypothetical protein